MRIANTTRDSIVDGPGMRFTVFTQGCPHRCPGCHNPETHDFQGGEEVSVEELLKKLGYDPLMAGVTLSGGDPMCQAGECADFAREAKKRGLNIWVYTGYTYEHLMEEADPDRLSLLNVADVLVDGPFVENLKSYEALYRGSTNQRLIDLNQTRKTGKLVLWTRPDTLAHFTRPSS